MIDTKFTDQSDFSSLNNLCFTIYWWKPILQFLFPTFQKFTHAPFELKAIQIYISVFSYNQLYIFLNTRNYLYLTPL